MISLFLQWSSFIRTKALKETLVTCPSGKQDHTGFATQELDPGITAAGNVQAIQAWIQVRTHSSKMLSFH